MAEQEKITGRQGKWTLLLEVYIRQREIISINPYPEQDEDVSEDELPPSIKRLERNVSEEYHAKLYRWGMEDFSIGNFRVIYVIHDFHTVLLLHVFDKQYNGDIRRSDIEPAETVYELYLQEHPSIY
ncbi:hypothetical protein B0X71_14460 [Planococcus lenghuensis]|uniref:Type II toxin-antitoxin system RelE/ParE family toxin n=2 Tax=Planococcus lenghuensis TaxID=2213202 RepID=A0A1Q2L3Y6_9BACL|nr:hypothetical protein B0X71_14460 [Planococcus lenghuensis]